MDRRERNFLKREMSKAGTISVELTTEDDEETTVEFPAKYAVCGTCGGRGSHVNPSIDSHGLSAEDFDEDPDFAEDYLSGKYDVPCAECSGLRVVPVVDEACLSPEQKADFRRWEMQEAQRERWDREDGRTRRMESGGF